MKDRPEHIARNLVRLYSTESRGITEAVVLRLVRQRGPVGAQDALEDMLANPSATVSRPDQTTLPKRDLDDRPETHPPNRE